MGSKMTQVLVYFVTTIGSIQNKQFLKLELLHNIPHHNKLFSLNVTDTDIIYNLQKTLFCLAHFLFHSNFYRKNL